MFDKINLATHKFIKDKIESWGPEQLQQACDEIVAWADGLKNHEKWAEHLLEGFIKSSPGYYGRSLP